MPLMTLRQGLDAARAGNYALGAFNVTDALQAEAVLDAAASTGSPVIVQTLAGSGSHTTDESFWAMLHLVIDRHPEVPTVLHLDHGPDFETCRRALEAGFTSVMIDGSLLPDRRTPSSIEENVAVTAAVASLAHSLGASVEGELGTIGGVEAGGHRAEIMLADPDSAAAFVEQTGVDALAVAIGTSHGPYKFPTPPDGAMLRMDLIEEIAKRIPSTHLVMHGSSSLPSPLLDAINQYGGSMPRAWGVPEAEKVRSIAMGIRKINQGMDSHLAFTAAVRQQLAENGLIADPAPYLRAGREAMCGLIAERLRAFRSAGQAPTIAPVPLAEMRARYVS